MSLFKINQSARITITCPKCAHKQDELIARLKDSPTITCGGCSGSIAVKGDQLDALLKALGG